MTTLVQSAGSIRRGSDVHGRARIIVTGRLDATLARQLAAIWRQIAAQWPRGLAVDLTGISGATDAGIAAMSKCLAAGRRLAEGVDIAVSTAAGRRLLLAALDGA